MRLFLDTEFNEFKGPLISMALFPEDRYRDPINPVSLNAPIEHAHNQKQC